MSEISEYESRLAAALDKIATGMARLSAEDTAGLADALAAEREANAQLEARVRAIKEKQETTVASLQEEVNGLRAALTETDADLQRLRSVNAELRQSNASLRQANASGLADAELVNSAMEAEIEALRELHETNRAEIDRALAELEPMLGEAANA